MGSSLTSREVHLVRRPRGEPSLDDFRLVTVPTATPGDGELLVRNRWISVDPYMRTRMDAAPGYKPARPLEGIPGAYVGPFELDRPMLGAAVGEVIASNSPGFVVGDHVESMLGWRDYAVGPATSFRKLSPLPGVSLGTYLGALGMTGVTAYAGMIEVGALRENDRVFVSAAAGAVGSLACQLGKVRGCYVVGSTGSDEKARWLRDVAGVDHVINYKTCGDLARAVADAFPDGIDLHLANVGGGHLDAALVNMANFGRIAISGFVESYNSGAASPVRDLFMAVRRSLRIEGYTWLNHQHLVDEVHEKVGALITSRAITVQETVVDGLENAPQAVLDLFKGSNLGKMIVRVDGGEQRVGIGWQ